MRCAKDAVKEPFAIINADDFYGEDAFVKAAEFLINECTQSNNAIVGYQLSKTLSEYGTVSRGVCMVNENNALTTITERTKIFTENGAIVYEENETKTILPTETAVSMNFWCFHPSIFNLTEILFKEFPKDNIDNIKAEFFIPIIADHFINKFDGTIKMISTTAQWFGVTYKEDAASVKASLDKLIEDKIYPKSLWA